MTAPLVAGFARRLRNLPGPSRGASRPGVPFLPAELGDTARLSVEAAWGANLTAHPDTWSWTDITTDVRFDPGLSYAIGRGDESSVAQPAQCTMTLDNTSGRYSLGGQSPNWPNVRQGAPVRVRLDTGSGFETAFQGYTDGFTPGWDITGGVPTVALSASGTTRRLMQGKSPIKSSLRRAVESSTAINAYWPCEDLINSEALLPAGPAAGPMGFIAGQPSLASSSIFACSAPVLTLKKKALVAAVPTRAATSFYELRYLIGFPTAGGIPDQSLISSLYTSGTMARWDLVYVTGGLLRIIGYNAQYVVVLDATIGFAVDGLKGQMFLFLQQDGADIDYTFGFRAMAEYIVSAGFWTGTVIGQTLGQANRVAINLAGALDEVAIGHIIVSDVFQADDRVVQGTNANAGETATARIARVCAENSVPVTVNGSSQLKMGAQPVDTLLNVLRACETADQGLLVDGLGPGLAYFASPTRENAVAVLTASAGQLVPPFTPRDDDQRIRNMVIATRAGGASNTWTDTNGPLGTAVVGTFDSSVTVGGFADSFIIQYAGWLVHMGTVEGYRYPGFGLDLRGAPLLIPTWLRCIPGSRIDITDLDATLANHPTGLLSLILEGYTTALTPLSWRVAAACSPFEPWRIAVMAAESGDTSEYAFRLDTAGATVAAPGLAAGGTTLIVATTSGPLWTTVADDFPFDIEVGGIRVTVTNITGGSSPQTFTVTGSTVTKALSPGMPVKLWRLPALGL